jgi:hypothetical protein
MIGATAGMTTSMGALPVSRLKAAKAGKPAVESTNKKATMRHGQLSSTLIKRTSGYESGGTLPSIPNGQLVWKRRHQHRSKTRPQCHACRTGKDAALSKKTAQPKPSL